MLAYFKKILAIDRNPVLDICRGLAILMVVITHYFINYPDLPLDFIFRQGLLGVDLFFILSGYLVGREPLRYWLKNERQDFKTFYIKRAFKILPSYWFAILGGFFIYNFLTPFPFLDFKNREIIYYLTFTQNYTGSNVLFHAWSLCVEEHFYLFLPLSLYLLRALLKGNVKQLTISLILIIIAGNLLRYTSYLIGYETYAATHNRIDALTLGVLLALLDLNKNNFINRKTYLSKDNLLPLFIGITLLLIGLFIGGYAYHHEDFSNIQFKVIYHGVIPLSVFFILSQTIFCKVKIPNWLKLTSYFSYNWYLWNSILVFHFMYYIENPYVGFIPFIVITYFISVLITYCIEEPFMNLRHKILKRKN